MTDDDTPVQYLIHAALRPQLDEWLALRGFRVDRLPPEVEGPDSLPTYLVAPDDASMRIWAQKQAIDAASTSE